MRQKGIIMNAPTPVLLRKKGWIDKEEFVLIIDIQAENSPAKVKVHTGHICSWPGSHGDEFEVDNVKQTIVWGDSQLREGVFDSADDAHERCMQVKDAHLLRRDEAHYLKETQHVQSWFEGKYSAELCKQISEEVTQVLSIPLPQ